MSEKLSKCAALLDEVLKTLNASEDSSPEMFLQNNVKRLQKSFTDRLTVLKGAAMLSEKSKPAAKAPSAADTARAIAEYRKQLSHCDREELLLKLRMLNTGKAEPLAIGAEADREALIQAIVELTFPSAPSPAAHLFVFPEEKFRQLLNGESVKELQARIDEANRLEPGRVTVETGKTKKADLIEALVIAASYPKAVTEN